MPYTQNIDRCLASSIGGAGVQDADLAAVLARTERGIAATRAAHGDGSLPLLQLPNERSDLPKLRDVAAEYRERYDDVIILGTGGSSLGGQTLCALADRGFHPPTGAPRLHFIDNVDPDTFRALLGSVDATRTGVVAISKSGGTTETLAQFLVCHDALTKALGEKAAGTHFTVVSEPGDNVVRRLASRFGMATLDHDPGIGGRFSVLSLVGLIPALIFGLDAQAIRAGAGEVLAPVLDGADPSQIDPAVGAALSVALCEKRGISCSVIMPYVDRLAHFGLWYRQLWAESLGKGGKGTTPIRAMGTVDQHSQLQLYIDGPRDKMFSVVTLACAGDGVPIDAEISTAAGLGYLAGRTLGDVMDAEQRATIETLAKNGRPTRVIDLPNLDERVMGALLMHFMLETIIAADLLGVNAFDQPAVEEGKILTREYLIEMQQGGRA